jgi:aryl-alcohol dehydrogenase-like predicted oxidoreductase
MSRPGITAPIIGPRTLPQLIDNLGALDVKIGTDDFARIDKLAPPMSATLRYYDASMGLDTKPNYGRW